MRQQRFVGSVLLLLASARGALAQSADAAPLEIPRLAGSVAIDGVPDEAAWQAVAPLPLTMYTPVFRGTPTQRSEIRVAYDDEYFYAAGWFYDTDPQGIRVNSLYRDRWNGDDAFAIFIDSFDDKRNAKWFGTTPGGIRYDILLSDDGATSNGSWDTFWDAATTITAEGWFAEVRIPLSSLGFRVDAEGRARMGLTVTRAISRNDERVTFPAIDPRIAFRRPSVAREIVLRDVRPHTPVYVTPYVLSGMTRRASPLAAGGFRSDARTSRDVGLDVKYPLAGNLTLDLTANTDFAQVEADDQQINLDRFPLYFPERRRFFQEGSGVFDFVAGGGLRLFNSRRVGLTPALEPVPVVGGGRLVGRIGAWDVGALDMETQALGAFPRENFGVARVRRQLYDAGSTAGLIATSYAGGDRRNAALGADGVFHLGEDRYLTLKAAGSFDSRDSASLAARTLLDARFERRVERGLQYSLQATRAARDFAPELAFLPRRDFTLANAVANWFFFTDGSRVFRRVYPGALAFQTWRNADHALESAQWAAWIEWDTKNGGGGWVEPKRFHENVAEAFTIGGKATVPAGAYDFGDLQVALAMSQGARLRAALDLRAGSYFDGRRAQAIVTPTWNVSPHLELGSDYQLTRLSFPSRDEAATIQLVRLRILAAADARRSGNAIVQYNSTTDRLDFNVRMRYAFAEGTDLWLVWNEGLDTDRVRDDAGIVGPRSLSRALILKYTHTFGF